MKGVLDSLRSAVADAKLVRRYLAQTGPKGTVAAGRLALKRRSHDGDFSPEVPIGSLQTVAQIRRHYALDSRLVTLWSEFEVRRDIRRISAQTPNFPERPQGCTLCVSGAEQLRHALATIEALRSWPSTRSVPIEVRLNKDSGEAWGLLNQIPGVVVLNPQTSSDPSSRSELTRTLIPAGTVPDPMYLDEHSSRLAASRRAKVRLLVVAKNALDIRRSSGAQDVYWFVRHSVALGYDVLFVATQPRADDGIARWELRSAGAKVLNGRISRKRILNSLPRTLTKTDLVAVFDKELAVKVRSTIGQAVNRPKVLFLPLDLVQFPQRVLLERGLGAQLEEFGLSMPHIEQVEMLAYQENSAIRASDLTALISTAELEALKEADFADRLTHLPMLRSDPIQVSRRDGSARLVFVGGFRHAPNYLAVQWFLAHVWPVVQHGIPGLVFEIYGADLDRQWRERWEAHVDVLIHGPYELEHEPYVGDVVAVAPLIYGGGTKGKVVSAVGHGAVVVGTEYAAQGLPTDFQRALVIADNPSDFASQVVALLQNAARRSELRLLGQRAYRDNFSEAAGREHVRQCLTLLANRAVV